MDNGTLVLLVVLGVFLILGIIVFTRYRKAEGAIKLPGGAEVTVKGDNSAPDAKPQPAAPAQPAPADVNVKGVKSAAGGLYVDEQAGGRVNVEQAEVQDDIIVSRKQGDAPKA